MPDRYRVTITPRACSDLESIYLYIAKESPKNASVVIAQLIDAVDSLELLPHRNVIYSGEPRPSEAVRRMPVPPFLIYYRVNDANLAVDVITIRHGKRQQPRRLE